jgi:hypothetical protein
MYYDRISSHAFEILSWSIQQVEGDQSHQGSRQVRAAEVLELFLLRTGYELASEDLGPVGAFFSFSTGAGAGAGDTIESALLV